MGSDEICDVLEVDGEVRNSPEPKSRMRKIKEKKD